MKEKKEDDIMAEYLLKGGKMLEKTCKQCGCPQFEYKGATFCVVCAEREQERKKSASSSGGTASPETRSASAGPVDPIPAVPDESDICVVLSAIIFDLCGRIKEEENPDRCLVIMDAIKIGAETLQILRQR